MANKKSKRRTTPRPPGAKPPRVRTDRGSLGTRLAHARNMLNATDLARLERLILVTPAKLAEANELDLGTVANPIQPDDAAHIERERLFAKARSAPFAAERKDPIGRAWFEGLLDDHGCDPAVMRELGREYGWLYWQEYARLDAKACAYSDMVSKAQNRKWQILGNSGAAGHRWERFEQMIALLGSPVRVALQRLCVDDMWFSQGPDWLDRLINDRRAKAKAGDDDPVITARAKDHETMALAVSGLRALVEGTEPERKRRAIRKTASPELEAWREIGTRAVTTRVPAEFIDDRGYLKDWSEIASILRGEEA